jgi:hypothetical protein
MTDVDRTVTLLQIVDSFGDDKTPRRSIDYIERRAKVGA